MSIPGSIVKFIFVMVLSLILNSHSVSQDRIQLKAGEDSKIWPRKQIDVLRALY